MPRYINADRVNASLDRIREEVWLHDIPSPTVPEYIEHHDAIQQIMLVIDKERKLLSDAADVAPVRRGRWITTRTQEHDGEMYCNQCDRDAPTEGDYRQVKTNFCPHCGAKMDAPS